MNAGFQGTPRINRQTGRTLKSREFFSDPSDNSPCLKKADCGSRSGCLHRNGRKPYRWRRGSDHMQELPENQPYQFCCSDKHADRLKDPDTVQREPSLSRGFAYLSEDVGLFSFRCNALGFITLHGRPCGSHVAPRFFPAAFHEEMWGGEPFKPFPYLRAPTWRHLDLTRSLPDASYRPDRSSISCCCTI